MDSLPPFVILLAPFVDGPALVQIITDPPALSMPPTLTGQQLRGFALALSKVVLNGGQVKLCSWQDRTSAPSHGRAAPSGRLLVERRAFLGDGTRGHFNNCWALAKLVRPRLAIRP
jgi:hypothetical protein